MRRNRDYSECTYVLTACLYGSRQSLSVLFWTSSSYSVEDIQYHILLRPKT